MKTWMMMIFAAAAGMAYADRVALLDASSEQNGVVTYRSQHFANTDTLAKVGAWKPGDGKPAPVTRDQAVALAMASARAGGRTDFKESATEVELSEAVLVDDAGEKIRVPRGTCLWFYEITFNKESTEPEDIYVVSMDGKVAIRIIKR